MLQPFGTVRRPGDFEAIFLECLYQVRAEVGFILHVQNADHVLQASFVGCFARESLDGGAGRSRSSAMAVSGGEPPARIGRMTVKLVPLPSVLPTVIVPVGSSTRVLPRESHIVR